MSYYNVLITVIPEIEKFVDEKRWNRFNMMRQKGMSFFDIASELKISVIEAMALETPRKCIIKWDGDTENLGKCVRGEIDP
jgi:hypothetical protein